MKTYGIPAARRARGFTLIELMIVVTVVAILAAIALPIYNSQIQQSQRTDAKDALLNLASREERYFTLNNTYTSTWSSLGFTTTIPASGVPLGSGSTPDYYMNITAATATGYTLTAAPNGNQITDACGTYSLDNFGNQSNTPAPSSGTTCW